MATIDLGRIKPVWQGTWAGSTAYEVEDIVRYGADSYICTTAHTSDASTFTNDSANWEVMAQGSDLPTQSGQSGKVLKTDGSTLSWGQAGGMVPILSYSSANYGAQFLDIDNIFSDDYATYKMFLDLTPATNGDDLRMRLLANGTQEAGGAYRSISGGVEGASGGQNCDQARNWYNQNEWQLQPAGGSIGNDSTRGGVLYELTFYNVRKSGVYSSFNGNAFMVRDLGDNTHSVVTGGMCMQAANTAFTGVRFYPDSGNINRVSVSVFGVTGTV
jgi:hypothetical protein